jgi:hypothetical protein
MEYDDAMQKMILEYRNGLEKHKKIINDYCDRAIQTHVVDHVFENLIKDFQMYNMSILEYIKTDLISQYIVNDIQNCINQILYEIELGNIVNNDINRDNGTFPWYTYHFLMKNKKDFTKIHARKETHSYHIIVQKISLFKKYVSKIPFKHLESIIIYELTQQIFLIIADIEKDINNNFESGKQNVDSISNKAINIITCLFTNVTYWLFRFL